MMKRFISFLIFVVMTGVIYAQSNDDRGYIVQVGDPCPEFTLTFTDGTTLSKPDLAGQVFMLQFTASWCGVCRKEMPHIESEIWKPYQDKGLRVIGVDRGEDKETVKIFVSKMDITYPIALDEDQSIFQKFALPKAGVTRNVLVNKDGNIIFLTRLFNQEEFDKLKDRIALEFKN